MNIRINFITSRQMAHVQVGAMIAIILLLSTYLIIGQVNGQIALFGSFLAGYSWEVWNKYQHKFGKPKNIFDKWGLISTIMGGSTIVIAYGFIEILILIF